MVIAHNGNIIAKPRVRANTHNNTRSYKGVNFVWLGNIKLTTLSLQNLRDTKRSHNTILLKVVTQKTYKGSGHQYGSGQTHTTLTHTHTHVYIAHML